MAGTAPHSGTINIMKSMSRIRTGPAQTLRSDLVGCPARKACPTTTWDREDAEGGMISRDIS
jgi:hypothetical protein